MADLPGVGDQLLNRMANWPKWASEESINNLTATVARGNKQIADLNKQMITLMREQKNTANKQDKQQSANTKTQSNDALNTRILNNSSSMLKNLNVGFVSMLKEQQRANALLRAMNAKLGSALPQNMRDQARTQNIRDQARTQNMRDQARTQNMRDQNSRMNNTFGGGINRRNARRRLEDDQMFDNLSKQTRKAFEEAISTMGSSSDEIKRNTDRLAKEMRDKFGAAIDPAIDKFKKQVDAASGDLDRLGKAFKEFGRNVSYRQDPRESNKDYFERMKRAGLEQTGGILETLTGGKGAIAAGAFALLMKNPALVRFAPMIAAASAALGLLSGVAKQLFELWKGSTLQTTQALSQGLVGLTDSVLSFAIHAKTAGLTVEQFSKLVQSAGGMINLLDVNARDAGRAFAGGVKSYLDAARAFNYFGMSLDDLNKNFGRQIQIVALAGMRGEQAIKTAQDMALREADTVYRLSVATGKPVERLNAAFDELYRNDMFRMATTRMLARGEQRAAAEVSNLAKAFVAASDEFGKGLAEELSLSAIAGVDPAMLGENYRQMMMMFPEMERAIRQAQQEGKSPEEIRAVIAQQAQGIMRNPAYQGQLGMMAMNPEMRPMLRFLQQAGEARTDVAAAGGPTSEGARGAAAEIDRQRAIEMAKGEVLQAIEATGVMKAFEALSRAAFEVVNAFAGLPDAIKATILGLGALAALIGTMALARGGRAMVGGFGRGGAPGPTAPTGPGVPPGGPPRPGTPPAGAPVAPTTSPILDAQGRPMVRTPPTSPALPPGVQPSGTPTPLPNAAAGAATRMTTALKGVGGSAARFGALGALLGVGINEFTSVAGLQNARKQLLDKYQRGEISREDAEKGLVEIDDAISTSRGGSLARGGVSAAGGAIGGTVGAISGLGVASVPVGIAGAVGGGILADTLLGGVAESAGGFVSRQLFGGSNRSARRELDALRPLSRQPGPRPQPGATATRTTQSYQFSERDLLEKDPELYKEFTARRDQLEKERSYRAALFANTPGIISDRRAPRAEAQIQAINEFSDRLKQSGALVTTERTTSGAPVSARQGELPRGFVPDQAEAGRRTDQRLTERYGSEHQAGLVLAANPNVYNDVRSQIEMEMRAEELQRRRRTLVAPGAVQTPDGRAMRPMDTQTTATDAAAVTGDSQTMTQAARAQNTQDNVRNLVERQDRTNELLAAMLNQQTIQASDSRRTVDVLETLNNKS